MPNSNEDSKKSAEQLRKEKLVKMFKQLNFTDQEIIDWFNK